MADYITLKDIAERIQNKDLLGLADETGLLSDEDLKNIIDGQNVVGSGAFLDAIQQCIDDAQSEVNTYLTNKYNVPFENVPKIIIKTTAEIAIYYLYSMGYQDIPDNWAVRYKQSLSMLKAIAKGDVSIGVQEKIDTTSNDAMCTGRSRIFSRDSLKGY